MHLEYAGHVLAAWTLDIVSSQRIGECRQHLGVTIKSFVAAKLELGKYLQLHVLFGGNLKDGVRKRLWSNSFHQHRPAMRCTFVAIVHANQHTGPPTSFQRGAHANFARLPHPIQHGLVDAGAGREKCGKQVTVAVWHQCQ